MTGTLAGAATERTAFARQAFREQLAALIEMIKAFPDAKVQTDLPEIDRVRRLPALFRANIPDDEPPPDDRYYSYQYDGGNFYLSAELLEGWETYCSQRAIDLAEREAMAHLFLLHEMFHTRQGLSSYLYHDTDEAPNILYAVDYIADALSIAGCYHLYTYCGHSPWDVDDPKQIVVKLIRAAIRVMEVFSSLYGAFPMTRCTQRIFMRYFAWHFQYARAQRWRGSVGALCQALRALPIFDLEGLPPRFDRRKFSRKYLKLFFTLLEPLHPWECHRGWGDTVKFSSDLFDGITNGNCEQSTASFNKLFDQWEWALYEPGDSYQTTGDAKELVRTTYRTITGFLNATARMEEAHDVHQAAQRRGTSAEEIAVHERRFDKKRQDVEKRMFEVSDVLAEVRRTFQSSDVLDAARAFVDWYHRVAADEERAGCGPDSPGQQNLRQLLMAMEGEIQHREIAND